MSFLGDLFGAPPPGPSGSQVNGSISNLSGTGTNATNLMNAYGSTGQQGLNTGLQNLQPVANWFQTIMGGNKAATLNQLQPQIQQIQGGLNTGLQTASTLSPRGGGRSSTLFDLPIEAQKDIASQYGAARAAAPAGLQSAATAQGALGASAGGVGSSFGQVGNSANNNLLNYGLQQNQQAQQAGGMFGNLLGGLINLAAPGVGSLITGALGGGGNQKANAANIAQYGAGY